MDCHTDRFVEVVAYDERCRRRGRSQIVSFAFHPVLFRRLPRREVRANQRHEDGQRADGEAGVKAARHESDKENESTNGRQADRTNYI